MTAARWPTVRICECGRLRQEHRFVERDREHLRPLGTDNGACAGYVEARVEKRPPESELRRRLAAVVALADIPPPGGDGPAGDLWVSGWDAAVTAAVLAARGET